MFAYGATLFLHMFECAHIILYCNDCHVCHWKLFFLFVETSFFKALPFTTPHMSTNIDPLMIKPPAAKMWSNACQGAQGEHIN